VLLEPAGCGSLDIETEASVDRDVDQY